MQDAHRLLEMFLKIKVEAENPIELFGEECEKQITDFIQEYLDENQLSLSFLNRDQEKKLAEHLQSIGIFNYKSAAPLISQKLAISRASVYNYIKNP